MSAMEPVDLLIRGDLVLPDRILRDGMLAVRAERIAAISDSSLGISSRREIDARGRLVLPGLIDTHVHTLSAPSEGITTATAAAAAGGVTTIVDMPYDAPGPVNNSERLRQKIAEVQSAAHVDVGLYGTIAKLDGLEAIPDLVKGGVLAFKLSLFETNPARFPRIGDGDLYAAFSTLSKTDLPIVLHAELQEIIESGLKEYRGKEDALAHGRTRPVVSETAAIAKAMELALWTGARVHVAHVTHPRGFELIDWYRRSGARVSGETCLHYLALSEDDVVVLGPLAKVNPPIRDRAAREGLWEDLKAGRVATVSTDHAPWPLEAKQKPMLAAASGMPGLETLLPVLYTEATRRGVSAVTLARLTSQAPAEIFGLSARKGHLAVGLDADFVIFNPNRNWRIDASRSYSSAKWSPFDGRTVEGAVEGTYLRGRPVFENGQIVAGPGTGRWLERPSANGR